MPDNSAYATTVPEQAQSFQNWFDANYPSWAGQNPNSLGYQVTGLSDKLKQEYETYLHNLSNRNEYAATQSARAWDEYMSSTQYQRAVKDLEAAGLNPYLLISSGSAQPASVSSAARASYGSMKNSDQKKNSDGGRNAALILLAVARLVAALA